MIIFYIILSYVAMDGQGEVGLALEGCRQWCRGWVYRLRGLLGVGWLGLHGDASRGRLLGREVAG